MTKRELKQKQIENYIAQTKEINYNVVPTKNIDNGRGGKQFEMLVKFAIGNYNFKGVSKSGRLDTTKKKNGERLKIEIKQNAGELATLDENGNIIDCITKNDIIIYAPEYNPNAPVELQAYVMNATDFYNGLVQNGCIRYKTSTAVNNAVKQGYCEKYHDKITIQNNSLKKLDKIYDLCEEIGVSLKEWVEG